MPISNTGIDQFHHGVETDAFQFDCATEQIGAQRAFAAT